MTDASFPRFMGGWGSLAAAGAASVAVSEGQLLLALGLTSLATVGLSIGIGSLYLEGENVGRGRSWQSRAARRFASIVWLQVRGCGCVYSDGIGDETPRKEWTEHETVWVRETHGGRVKFRKAKTGLRRCHRCGKHYSDTEEERSRAPRLLNLDETVRECWPEEEPDVRAELDERVVDQEVVND